MGLLINREGVQIMEEETESDEDLLFNEETHELYYKNQHVSLSIFDSRYWNVLKNQHFLQWIVFFVLSI